MQIPKKGVSRTLIGRESESCREIVILHDSDLNSLDRNPVNFALEDFDISVRNVFLNIKYFSQMDSSWVLVIFLIIII